MRGYFGIGVEGVSKPGNVGSLMRTAHAFGASFVFTIGADYSRGEGRADTSSAPLHVPFYDFPDLGALVLPQGCKLVGVELLDEAAELPSFHHPACAAYVLGRERGDLSPDLLARCDFVVRIPTRFCVNLAVAGAIVLYDRLLALGRHAPRPSLPGGPAPRPAEPGAHHGGPRFRSPERMDKYRDLPPPGAR